MKTYEQLGAEANRYARTVANALRVQLEDLDARIAATCTIETRDRQIESMLAKALLLAFLAGSDASRDGVQ